MIFGSITFLVILCKVINFPFGNIGIDARLIKIWKKIQSANKKKFWMYHKIISEIKFTLDSSPQLLYFWTPVQFHVWWDDP